MPVEGIYHVNVVCTDLVRSRAFYELLGFQSDIELPEGSDPAVATALGLPHGTSGKAVVMMIDREARRSCRLDLLEWTAPPTVGAPYPTLLNAGIARFNLATTDLQQEYERLTAAGVEFLSPPMRMRSPEVLLVCAKDPDGTIVEFMEFAPGPAA